MRSGFGMQIVVRQSNIGGQGSCAGCWRNSLSTLDVRTTLFRDRRCPPPITLADNGGQASAGPLERLGTFLGKEGAECDRLGKFCGESAWSKHASCSTSA